MIIRCGFKFMLICLVFSVEFIVVGLVIVGGVYVFCLFFICSLVFSVVFSFLGVVKISCC